MKAKDIQELLDFIAKSGLNKVDIETEEFKISVQRDAVPKIKYVNDPGGASAKALASPTTPASAPISGSPSAGQLPEPAAQPAPAPAPAAESNYIAIKSP